MPDHAISTDAAVQRQLDRLWSLSPGADVLGLGRITALLDRLGNPQDWLPPVFHVAGTNGKGSTCAFLRAIFEADGRRVHVYSSPHLVRFNERIRVAGTLIDDPALAALLEEVLDAGGDLGASFFEVTTAAAFLAFSRTPADACIVEVGLGGRLDATNVVHPLVTGIAGLGIDHEAFLLAEEAGTPAEPMARIAFEKAGIAKSGVPLVTQRHSDVAAASIDAVARERGAPLMAEGSDWYYAESAERLNYVDASGRLMLPLPSLLGPHQAHNAGLAIAMLRHQQTVRVQDDAFRRGLQNAHWPGRLQRLRPGPLTALLPHPPSAGVWLDGAHNESAAAAIAHAWSEDRPTVIILGMLANKDATGVLNHLARIARTVHVIAVPVPRHAHHDPAALARLAGTEGAASALTASSITEAMRVAGTLAVDRVLIAGSLYLAGEVLAANDEIPT
ncbi:bifunctional folylpolyglutamate synthase/dihydrofolate synthase [Sphingomonas sp. NBWT7]|uniref:bifunctional folylpolyglutamate synthase/dihydrofolate synthase n=1 Tax=Sphingomonas sp. NBWT7 TaxID=2596913 RepID=UPI001629E937|nr:folylpolyglutamate synthase/dihydrofolate synthase family protein [Sphingomonas sp. NBWT7]QNE31152.1 bifunctional folylpolyglutamate synthase/dihydrofolate synthase [Sphingomonas sp. NBWT7]